MTQEQNIEYLQADIIKQLSNAYETRIRQIAINNPNYIANYKEQFNNFIRRVIKKSGKIYNNVKSNSDKELVITGNTKDFIFKYIVNPNKSSVFEMSFIQKSSKEFDSNFLLTKIKESFGYVYFLKSEYGYKIGCSSKLHNRLNHFNVLLPFKYEVYSIVKCKEFHSVESLLHKLLSHKRLNGEWFGLSENDFIEIDLLLINMDLKREDYLSIKQYNSI